MSVDITVYFDKAKAADWLDGDTTCNTHIGNAMVAALLRNQTPQVTDVPVTFDKARVKRWLMGDDLEFGYIVERIKTELGQ